MPVLYHVRANESNEAQMDEWEGLLLAKKQRYFLKLRRAFFKLRKELIHVNWSDCFCYNGSTCTRVVRKYKCY